MKNINVQQLRAFHALMKIGHMTRAAEFLHVAQPTISRQLQLLEESLGFRTFDRKSGGRLTPTKEGQLLFEQLERTLTTLDALPEISRGIRHYESRRLRVAATTPALNSDILINAVAALREANPHSTLHLERVRRENIEMVVANAEAEIGFCAMPIANSALDVVPLVSTRAVAVVAPFHRLADRPFLSIDDVPSEELILATTATIGGRLQRRDHVDDAPPPPVRVHLVLTGLRLAAAGLGVLVCDPLTATAFRAQNIRILPWRPDIRIDFCCIVSKERRGGVVLDKLVQHLRRSAGDWQTAFEAEFGAPT
ncbi:LysR family transcriptional regulator [Phaeobacter sp. J2-8]|uniref:LysR family transcriptional regulator n=1 Tax=Phaeobacter sp. J2-8 TaxID=2931394 RepID=UPI001FD4ACD0|nr:LysR family transcriptional regulator [Phaeobacter sp. J2-8]